jgi:hypothetical protein
VPHLQETDLYGLGTFEQTDTEIVLYRPIADEERCYDLSWTGCTI